MMVIVAEIEKTGFFQYAAIRVAQKLLEEKCSKSQFLFNRGAFNCNIKFELISLSKAFVVSNISIFSPCFLKKSRSTFLSLLNEHEN